MLGARKETGAVSGDPQSLIGCSAAMQRVRGRIERFARSPVPILIVGETGTGKELCAEAIFRLSGYAPFVPLNCAAIPEGVAESELFGHERGAFTGAVQSRVGVVAQAHGGTLFLDELAELPGPLQAKLLRTLESGEYRPVGAADVRRSLFRILAATSGDLRASVAAGRLREDLLHRVSAVRIALPPLRARLEDIPPLAADLLRRYRARAQAGPARITPDACALLMQQPWPGNVRELRNVIEASAAAAGSGEAIGVAEVMECLAGGGADGAAPDELLTLAQVPRGPSGGRFSRRWGGRAATGSGRPDCCASVRRRSIGSSRRSGISHSTLRTGRFRGS